MGSYRYGFNGKENDNEVEGVGNQIDYGMRVYDPRIGRFMSVDPLIRQYPWYTPYQFAGNKPIFAVDLDGLEEASANLTWSQRWGLAFIGMAATVSGHPKEGMAMIKVSTDISNGYQGPLAPLGQKVVTSVGSTLGGGLHALTIGAYPLDPSAELGGGAALNQDASNWGGLGTIFLPTPFHGTPGAGLELAPSQAPIALPSLNFSLRIPLILYSNSPQTGGAQGDGTSSSESGINEKPQIKGEPFKAPLIFRNQHGQLTNGKYILDEVGMEPHTTGDFSLGKSQFLFNVEPNKTTLDAAAYADKYNLWSDSKAKVPIANGAIGVSGKTGNLTEYINIYRTKTNFVHSSPGDPPKTSN